MMSEKHSDQDFTLHAEQITWVLVLIQCILIFSMIDSLCGRTAEQH